MTTKKIVAFAGSDSSTSINKKLVNYALSEFKDHEITLLDLNDFEMPLYSINKEKKDGVHEKAHLFRDYLKNSDAIICSLAEHNNSYTVAFKNILDWCSRVDMKVFGDKPMFLMSTSPGGYGGGNVMNHAKSFFPKCGAVIIDTFSLPSFNKNFTENGIENEELNNELLNKIRMFKECI